LPETVRSDSMILVIVMVVFWIANPALSGEPQTLPETFVCDDEGIAVSAGLTSLLAITSSHVAYCFDSGFVHFLRFFSARPGGDAL
ncbi:MAG: hypothetical protein ACRYGR_09195, partial [Janthinobacterium lividum]